MKLSKLLLFIILASPAFAQHESTQEAVTDAIQSQKITDMEADIRELQNNLAAEVKKTEELQSDLSAIRGIGIGLVTCLTVLQGVIVLVVRKK